MVYVTSPLAVGVFLAFVLGVLALSWWLGRGATSASGYYAAHGQIHWFVNGIAFAGDYLSAASFLGICGMIAFYGYDGFLYSIGYLAGWIVALFVVAEPLKRMGKFTFADALDARFQSRGIKLAAAISTLVVSLFYLIPQMVGAGVLIKPLLGFSHASGVLMVGIVVTIIVVTAGMVSTTWVQFIKGGLLVAFCLLLTVMILRRGFEVPTTLPVTPVSVAEVERQGPTIVDPDWPAATWLQVQLPGGAVHTYRRLPDGRARLTQVVTTGPDGTRVDGVPQGLGDGQHDLTPIGAVTALPGGVTRTGPLGPMAFLRTFNEATIETWTSERREISGGRIATVYTPRTQTGADLLQPGASPTFRGVRSSALFDKLDFLSLMLALFAGTASLPHILIRYYTVKDVMAVRKSTVTGIGAIGLFYVLTLYLGLGAMTSGALDVTNTNMAAPLLARSFSEPLFAVISAIAFTTVLGTVSGLILAASGAVVHDLLTHVVGMDLTDDAKVRAGKIVAVGVGIVAMLLGVAFEKLNVSFLVGWAFNVAASANLPSLVMLLFWKRTTKEGIVAAILVGMASSLGWILCSAQAFKDVYGWPPETAPVPFSQPGIVTIPLGFLVLVAVSLMTRPSERQMASASGS
ncbi:cation acetate symporter [Luteitalea sp.]|uniref:sodium/solute symporter n=1 Tax=Luteitalea sp. TaxID=2004800 RepID=UPI0025B817B3|nr:cation acetate symporter [Luteitalea sp.]